MSVLDFTQRIYTFSTYCYCLLLLFIRQSGWIFNSFVVVLERYTTFEIQVRQIRNVYRVREDPCNQDPISNEKLSNRGCALDFDHDPVW